MPTFSSLNKTLISLAGVLCVCLLGGPARADDDRDFQDHYQRALQLYKLNFLRQAIKEFIAAYAANPLPRLLYNLGQIQRRVGDYKDAIESYELYLRTEIELTPERRQEVQKYIEALQAASPGSAPAVAPIPEPPPESLAAADKTTTPPSLLLILPPQREGKAGRLMFNMGLGYSFPFFSSTIDGGLGGMVVRPELSVAVLPSRNGYVVFTPQFQLVQNTYTAAFTVGFQYDFPILARGLFLYLRGSAGYGLVVGNQTSYTTVNGVPVSTQTMTLTNIGLFIPELGFKYVVNGKVNFGFEPVSLPISFTASGVGGSFRQVVYGGYNF